jgi:predicted nucleic acid-binding protein
LQAVAEMAERSLLDTDVLIDYLRGHTEAATYVESLTEPLLISAITLAELYAGVRDGEEREALDAFISAFDVVPVEHEIALKGGLYRRDYGKSHNVGLADALVAATAELRQATLVTLNKKHFPMLTDVVVPYQKP